MSAPAPTTPRAVVFDVGNVLVNWDPDLLYAGLIPDPAERAAFRERVGIDAMNLEGDRGLLAEAVAAAVAAHPADAHLIQVWWDRWHEMFRPEIPGAFALMERLKALGVPVFGLTNFAADSWPRGVAAYPGLGRFDMVVVSGEDGVIKPDPAIYALVEERSGFSGSELFFADDRTDNIAAAKARGWQGHVFEGTPGLEAALRAVGIAV